MTTPVPKLLNTYKLDSERPFNIEKVYKVIVQVANEVVEEVTTYHPETAATKAKWASDIIRTRVKEFDYERYKLICIFTIGEKKSHDVFSCLRFLWDMERDKYVTYMAENMQIFAVAAVFGIYYE